MAAMRKKLIFIFNPRSGKGKIKTMLLDIIDIFTKAGYDVTAYPTQSKGDGAAKIRKCASEYDMVVISGGDGTLSEGAAGMIAVPEDKRVPLGYIPAGTMNDFASGNGIPKTMLDAAKEIVNGQVLNYDIGQFNEASFIYVAGFGAFTDVSYDTPQTTKNIFGNMAYFFEGIKRLPSIEAIKTRVTTVEGEVLEENVYWCLIMNTTSVAGFSVGDFYEINADDGLFEIMLISKSTNIMNITSIINDIRLGKRNASGVKVVSTAGAVIELEKPVRWTLDGEFGGALDRVEMKVLHNAVQFVFDPKTSKNLTT